MAYNIPSSVWGAPLRSDLSRDIWETESSLGDYASDIKTETDERKLYSSLGAMGGSVASGLLFDLAVKLAFPQASAASAAYKYGRPLLKSLVKGYSAWKGAEKGSEYAKGEGIKIGSSPTGLYEEDFDKLRKEYGKKDKYFEGMAKGSGVVSLLGSLVSESGKGLFSKFAPDAAGDAAGDAVVGDDYSSDELNNQWLRRFLNVEPPEGYGIRSETTYGHGGYGSTLLENKLHGGAIEGFMGGGLLSHMQSPVR